MKIETIAVHAGRHADPASGAVELPIHLSTTFKRNADGSLPADFVYSRNGNPTRRALEDCLTALEGGADASAFASGSAAVTALLHALEPEAHVVLSEGYYGTGKILSDIFARWKLKWTMVDGSNTPAIAAAIKKNTRLIFLESPSNPMIRVCDISAVCELARKAGAKVAVDNTVCTPVLQRPFELGADLVMYSTTKFMAGHSDVVGGALVTAKKDDYWQKVQTVQQTGGGVPGPFDCWLALRGLKTLPYRVRAHSDNAMKVATFLAGHRAVEKVNYPGLEKHPQHAIAARQMKMFGGLMSFHIAAGRAAALAVTSKTRIFTRATSLGGTESLIEHRESVEAPGTGTPENLIRLSIGLENSDDLIEDLSQALG